MRNSHGDWCVAVPVREHGYGTVYNMRRLRRIPIGKDAPRDRAESVARSLGLMEGDQ